MISTKVKRQLQSVDWDFPTNRRNVTKNAHWYPGTFPSQLPSTFIQALTSKNDLIFDPYGGVGTTASESIRLGRKVWITDINPVGVLANYPFVGLLLLRMISIEKFNFFFKYIEGLISKNETDLLSFGIDFLDSEIESYDLILQKHMRPKPHDLLGKIRSGNQPNLENLKEWVHPRTLSELVELHKNANEGASNFKSIFIEFMISANMRALSSQNKSWGHIADNVRPKVFIYKNTKSQLLGWLKKIKGQFERFDIDESISLNVIRYWVEIHNWASNSKVSIKPKIAPNMILTSPPYGDAIDYILSQKLSFYFLGYTEESINNLSKKEFGARRKRFNVNSRLLWAEDITKAAIKQSAYLKSGNFVSILPHKNHGREIGIKTMTEGLKENGWVEAMTFDRSINQKKARQSWTSIKQETITIFSKG